MCQSWIQGCSLHLPQWCFQTLTAPWPQRRLSPLPFQLPPAMTPATAAQSCPFLPLPPHQGCRASPQLMSSFLAIPCPFSPLLLCFSQSNLESRLDYFNPALVRSPISSSSYPPAFSGYSHLPSHCLEQVLIEWKTTRSISLFCMRLHMVLEVTMTTLEFTLCKIFSKWVMRLYSWFNRIAVYSVEKRI